MLDKAKMLIEVNVILNSPFDPEKIIDLRDGIKHGTFDSPEAIQLKKERDESEFLYQMEKEYKSMLSDEVRQLREERDQQEYLKREAYQNIAGWQDQVYTLEEERVKLVKALEEIESTRYNNLNYSHVDASCMNGIARRILSEIKGQGDDK